MVHRHWTSRGLTGPDCGIRWNYRIGRFIKSPLPWLPWNDDYYYLQAQGYWTIGNWLLFARTRDEKYREIAVRSSIQVLATQRDDGAWEYPNVEWRGRVATAEGSWGSLGLLESYRHTGERQFLDGALRWHRFLMRAIGFQRSGDTLSVNYFAATEGARIPNNTAFLLRLLAELADLTGDSTYLVPGAGLLCFLRVVQEATGEFPYAVGGPAGGATRVHFQCYQYNAFQCLDLLRYYELTHNAAALPLIDNVLRFLRTGVAKNGHAYYACNNRSREVIYHGAVLAATFATSTRLGLSADAALAQRVYEYVLGRQNRDGGFPVSRGDYGLLQDRRSYPRPLAMILMHLLTAAAPQMEPLLAPERAAQNVVH